MIGTFEDRRIGRPPSNPIAGVYLIRCIATGESYVGASCDIAKRLKSHVAAMVSENHRVEPGLSMREKIGKAMDQGIEFRLLEVVSCPSEQTWRNWKCKAKLSEREAYWIDKLKPTINQGQKAPSHFLPPGVQAGLTGSPTLSEKV